MLDKKNKMIKLSLGHYMCQKCKCVNRLMNYYFENQNLCGFCENCGEKITTALFKEAITYKKIIQPPKSPEDEYKEEKPIW